MNRTCIVSINDEAIHMRAGERLLDCALRHGVDLPYDCREGRCGTCVVRIDEGEVLGGETGRPGYVRACQAHVLTDLVAGVDETTLAAARRGKVVTINPLSRDVCELVVMLENPLHYNPGQYVNLAFAGLPQRSFSPTAPIGEQEVRDRRLHFHIRQFPGGAVSSQIGKAIRLGSAVDVEGPFGIACLQPDRSNRLVLVSGGTGFAPIWAIAQAALDDNPDRDITMVIGARQTQDLYMAKAVKRLAAAPNISLKVTVDEGPVKYGSIKIGRPTEFLIELSAEDTVHVAGPPPLVAAVEALGREAGCDVFADAFVPAAKSRSLKKVFGIFRRSGGADTRTEPTLAAQGKSAQAAEITQLSQV